MATQTESVETRLTEMQYQIDELRKENELLKSNDQLLHDCLRSMREALDKTQAQYEDNLKRCSEMMYELQALKKDTESNEIKQELFAREITKRVDNQQKSMDNVLDGFGDILSKLHTLVDDVTEIKNNDAGLETLYHCLGDQVIDLEKTVKKIKKKIKKNKVTLTLS